MPSKSKEDRVGAEKAAWYADGLRFECTQCGNCCTGPPGFVWFDSEETEAIAAHLGISAAEFRDRYAQRKNGNWTLNEVRTESGDYDCVFLKRDENGKALCGIYPVRPTQCRTWPFWPENLGGRRAWKEAARDCPGMKQGLEGGGNFYPVEKVRIILQENPDEL